MLLKMIDRAIGCEGTGFVSMLLKIVLIIKITDFVLEPMFGFSSSIIGFLLATMLCRLHFQQIHDHVSSGSRVVDCMDTEKLERVVELSKVLNQKSSSIENT